LKIEIKRNEHISNSSWNARRHQLKFIRRLS